ncbi:LUD domain-containing protein [Geminicoccaceae bacterium 1502E]|nr:LUD domain-containing protein [Geminicoccaceae bacterium 1502E]
MSAARDAILARLRQAIGRTAEEQAKAVEAVRARLADPRPNLVPAHTRLDREGRVALFCEKALAVSAEVERLARIADAPAAVSAFLRRHDLPQKMVMAPEPMLDLAEWEQQPLLRVRRGTAAPDDAVGLTVAVAGIAETGTLMLASSREQPTLLAFLPETVIALLQAEDIDGAYEDSWQRLRDGLGRPPRSVNLVTGPSRTGDVGQKIELGAHGPRRLLVLVVEEAFGEAGDAPR